MEGCLIDTHVLIWMAQQPENIPAKSKEILLSSTKIFLSHVSVWEIAIKTKTGKLDVGNLSDFLYSSITNYRLTLLPISLRHIFYTHELPLHHRDPFDRLLIAQAASEQLTFVTADKAFDDYGVSRIWS
jgi:PIN domain nuclease of toxin-antitoxin system